MQQREHYIVRLLLSSYPLRGTCCSRERLLQRGLAQVVKCCQATVATRRRVLNANPTGCTLNTRNHQKNNTNSQLSLLLLTAFETGQNKIISYYETLRSNSSVILASFFSCRKNKRNLPRSLPIRPARPASRVTQSGLLISGADPTSTFKKRVAQHTLIHAPSMGAVQH